MMASIQTSFAIMPALVYGVAGHLAAGGNSSISIGTLVAFTTLQTRLFFPTSSLLGVQADVQASLALFDRVFEYLDLPVDIDEKPDATRSSARQLRGELRFRDVAFAYDGDRRRSSTSLRPPSRGRGSRWWARRAAARRPSATSPPGCTTRRAVASSSTGTTCATSRSTP